MGWKRVTFKDLKSLIDYDGAFIETIAITELTDFRPFFLGVKINYPFGSAKLYSGSNTYDEIKKKSIIGSRIYLSCTGSVEELVNLFLIKKIDVLFAKRIPPHTKEAYLVFEAIAEHFSYDDTGSLNLKLKFSDTVWMRTEKVLLPVRMWGLILEALVDMSRICYYSSLGNWSMVEQLYSSIATHLSRAKRITSNDEHLKLISNLEEELKNVHKRCREA